MRDAQASRPAGADRCFTLHDLERAEPDTMRYRLYYLPARLSHHTRRRWLRIERTWPWATAFVLARQGSPLSRPSPDRRPSP
ncbi:hypothetical protein [Kitasatospora sp. GP82]|uniref:hypothetical protein n=1 Tax=Kitasatospora sp. GP82 TaxID=3035089 RepID=UPI0024757E28|nr:hypothetical protein [Kitasatospora sp. GP82]MDH6124844.1 hypothetical protein [Kitasatospora sp. GP82]